MNISVFAQSDFQIPKDGSESPFDALGRAEFVVNGALLPQAGFAPRCLRPLEARGHTQVSPPKPGHGAQAAPAQPKS